MYVWYLFMFPALECISEWGVWSTIISILIFDIQPPSIFSSGLCFVPLVFVFAAAPEWVLHIFLYPYDVMVILLYPSPRVFFGWYVCRDVVFVVSVIMLVEEMRRSSKYIPLFE